MNECKPTITFETKCWEHDWEIICKSNRLERLLNLHGNIFDKRILYINNVLNYKKVCLFADRLVKRGVLTEYCIVRDVEQDTLDFFSISRDSFKGGYFYSIAELAALYRADTDFLYHLSSDTYLPSFLDQRWIKASISSLEMDLRVKVANLTWNYGYEEARKESLWEDGNFWYGYGFSDQQYLVRVSDFRQSIYKFHHPDSERYPAYGGELFEKRIDAWMRHNSFLRATYKHGSYYHKNFHRQRWLNKLLLQLGHFNRRWH